MTCIRPLTTWHDNFSVPDDFIKKKKKAVQCTAYEISVVIRAGHLPSRFGIFHQNLKCLHPERLLHENFRHNFLSHTCNCLSSQSTQALLCLSFWCLTGMVNNEDMLKAVTMQDIEGEDKEDLSDNWDRPWQYFLLLSYFFVWIKPLFSYFCDHLSFFFGLSKVSAVV